jgi:hypothetical protein
MTTVKRSQMVGRNEQARIDLLVAITNLVEKISDLLDIVIEQEKEK